MTMTYDGTTALFIYYRYYINITRRVDDGVNLGPRVAGVVGLCGSATGRRLCTAWRARSRRTVPEKKRALTDINIEGSRSIKRRNEFQARRTKWRDRKLFGPRPIFCPYGCQSSDGRRRRLVYITIL